MSDAYRAFMAAKAIHVPPRGLSRVPALSSHLFPFQADTVRFLLEGGSGGCFFDTGLGKTRVQLEYLVHAAAASNGRALLFTPIAVGRQIAREGASLGYPVHIIRDADGVREGINICNYERRHLLDVGAFGASSLDESSILKSFTGATTRDLIDRFAGHRFKMAATATPAPNDHMEIGQHAEFLSLMTSHEMLMRWFIADQTQMGRYRLKHHAVQAFYDWMASWARMAEHPRDLGDDIPGFDLPPLQIIRHRADSDRPITSAEGTLFAGLDVSATSLHDVKRQTAEARAAAAAAIVHAHAGEPCLIWCDTDYEADALLAVLPDARDVRGSQTTDQKEATLEAFSDGSLRHLITKPRIAGFGMNWQHCRRMVFVGRSFSYEAWYQAVRRCWRFGQTRPVEVHLIGAEGEDRIGAVIDHKADAHRQMRAAMAAAMRRAVGRDRHVINAYNPTHAGRLPTWLRSAS